MKYLLMIIMPLLALAANAYDLDSGRPLGLGGAVLQSEPSADDLNLCPAAPLHKGDIVASSGWNRRFELSQLDRVSLSAGYRFSDFTVTAGFAQLGESGYYTEKFLRAAVAYNYSRFRFALIGSGKEIEIGENLGKFRAASIGLAAGVKYKRYYLGMTIDNLNRPKVAETLDGEEIVFDVFAEIDGGAIHSLAGRIRFEGDHDPVISLGQYIYIMDRQALFWGISHNPLTYGGGIELAYGRFAILYSANYHNPLGFTHNVSINFYPGREKR